MSESAEDIHRQIAELTQRMNDYDRFHKLEHYRPYPKQLAFHNAGALERERLFRAGNQQGKTFCTSAENAIHATGRYPDWWEGKQFTEPTHGWALGESGESSRDTLQMLMFGDIPNASNWGTGWIPLEDLGKPVMSRNTNGLIDYCPVRHYTDGEYDGMSMIWMKTYGKGRERLASKTLHWINCDEEPGEDVYGELIPRINVHDGVMYIGFTAMKGWSKVILRFEDPQSGEQPLSVTQMGIMDVPEPPHGHYTREQKAKIAKSYLPHERPARLYGNVHAGSGMVFPISEDKIKYEPHEIEIPPWWPKLKGLDIGHAEHPTAVAYGAFDTDSDKDIEDATLYIYKGWREKELSMADVVSANRDDLPVAWPLDALQKERGTSSETEIAKLYQLEGFNMIGAGERGDRSSPNYACFPGGNNGVEAGLKAMYNAMLRGKLKICSTVWQWWDEFSRYHRKDGAIIAVKEDFISAVRYLFMMRRFAEAMEDKPMPRRRYEKPPMHADRTWMAN